MGKPYEIRIRVTDEGFEVLTDAKRDLRGMEDAAGGVDKKFQRMSVSLADVGNKLESVGRRMMLLGTGVVGGLGALTYAGVKYNATVEQMQANLKIFLGTQEKVNEAYEWASRFTLKVPLTRRDVIPIVTMLEQYGFAYEDWTSSVVNAAAATKRPGEAIQNQMETIAMAFGRIKTGQTGEGLLMLRRAGIAVENAGLRFSAAGEVIDEPRVVLEKLKKYLDTQFEGAAEEFGKTWEGQMMRIKSLAERALGSGTQALFDKLKTRLVIFTDYISSPAGQAKMKEWASILGRMMEAALRFGDKLVTEVLPKVMKFADWFGNQAPKFQWAITTFPLIGGFAAIAAGKILRLAGALRMAGLGGGVAAKGIGAASGAAGAGVGSILGYAAAVAAMVAQLYGLVKLSDWVAEKLGVEGWGVSGSAKKAWGFAKNWNPLAGKFGFEKEKKFVQEPGEGLRPKPASPTASEKGVAMWGKAMSGWEATPVGGVGDTVGGGGGGGGAGGGGGGGVGTRMRGGNTLYQTIEKVIINAKSVDEKAFMKLMGKIAESELPA